MIISLNDRVVDLNSYFPRFERGARPTPTLGRHVFQTTASLVLTAATAFYKEEVNILRRF